MLYLSTVDYIWLLCSSYVTLGCGNCYSASNEIRLPFPDPRFKVILHLLYVSPSFMSIRDGLYSLVLTTGVHSCWTFTMFNYVFPHLKLTEILVVMSLEQLQYFEARPLRKIKEGILMLLNGFLELHLSHVLYMFSLISKSSWKK